MTQPTVRASTKSAATSTTAPTTNKPTGTVSGDVIYLVGIATGGGVAWGNPTGFGAPLVGPVIPSAGLSMVVWRRVADGSEAATFTATITSGGGTPGALIAVSVQNADPGTPEEVTSASASGTTGTTATAPALTLVKTNDLLLTFYGNNQNSAQSTPGGMTELQDAGGTIGLSADSEALAAGGSTGTRASTFSPAGNWAAVTIAVQEVIPPVTVTPTDVQMVMAVPAPSITVVVTPTPTDVQMVLTEPAPTITASGQVTPTAVPLVMAFPAPTVDVGQRIDVPAEVQTTFAFPSPSITGDGSVAPAVVPLVMAFPAPSILVQTPVPAPTVGMVFAFPPPSITAIFGPVPVFTGLGRPPSTGPADRYPNPPYNPVRAAGPIGYRDGGVTYMP